MEIHYIYLYYYYYYYIIYIYFEKNPKYIRDTILRFILSQVVNHKDCFSCVMVYLILYKFLKVSFGDQSFYLFFEFKTFFYVVFIIMMKAIELVGISCV
jgi:hypothetical protein